MKFIKVPKTEGEGIRKQLVDECIFAQGYKVIHENDFLLFPITGAGFEEYEVVERAVEKLPEKFFNLKELLAEHLSESELEELITSYDIIGDIIIAEIPDALLDKEELIADALLKVNPAVRVVAKKLGPMEGEFRVRRIKVIRGENRTITTYKEHGCRMKLDVGKVYFSVRLGTERKRIAELVLPGERILALFAGVGPFPIVISKKHPDTEIVAIELNPEGVQYMKENIKLNHMKNIKPILGDAREIVLNNYQDYADRIIMPLPKTAESFLDVAFRGVKDGGIIHLYTFDSPNPGSYGAANRVLDSAQKHGVSIEILNRKVVRPYSPEEVQVVLDLKMSKA